MLSLHNSVEMLDYKSISNHNASLIEHFQDFANTAYNTLRHKYFGNTKSTIGKHGCAKSFKCP